MSMRFLLTVTAFLFFALGGTARADTSPEPRPVSWTAEERAEIQKRADRALRTHARERDWFRVPGPTCTVWSEVDARFSAEVSLFMDRLRERFKAVFGGDSRVSRRPDIYVYGDRAGFEKEIGSRARGWYRYACDGSGRFSEHALYTFVESPAERRLDGFPRAILVHEGTHMLVRELAGTSPLPPWLDEGLATYFQLWRLEEDPQENLASRPGRLVWPRDLARARAEGTLPSLPALLARRREPGSARTWNRDDFGPLGKADYAAAESLLVFLISDPARRKIAGAALDDAVAGRDPAEALERAGKAKLEKAWLEYVDGVLAPLAQKPRE